MNKIVVVLGLALSMFSFGNNNNSNPYIVNFNSILSKIHKFYKADVGNHLLNETYPADLKNVVSYVINQASQPRNGMLICAQLRLCSQVL